MMSEADTAPAADGAKRTVTSTGLPAATVKGAEGVTIVKAALLLEIERTARSPVPALLMVNLVSFEKPLVTAPKSSEVGVREIDGDCALMAPAPVTVMVATPRAGSLLEIESAADTGPAAFGANRTVTSADCPIGIVMGGAADTIVNLGLLVVIE